MRWTAASGVQMKSVCTGYNYHACHSPHTGGEKTCLSVGLFFSPPVLLVPQEMLKRWMAASAASLCVVKCWHSYTTEQDWTTGYTRIVERMPWIWRTDAHYMLGETMSYGSARNETHSSRIIFSETCADETVTWYPCLGTVAHGTSPPSRSMPIYNPEMSTATTDNNSGHGAAAADFRCVPLIASSLRNRDLRWGDR
jgi:hypothetical protein